MVTFPLASTVTESTFIGVRASPGVQSAKLCIEVKSNNMESKCLKIRVKPTLNT